MEHIHCPLCGGHKASLVFKRKDLTYGISEEEFCIVRCKSCSLVYVNPRPTEKEIHKYYPDQFYEVGSTAEQVYKNLEWRLKLKYQLVCDLPPGRLMDIGCNKGEFLYFMQQRGWDVQGIDFSSKPPNVFGLDIHYGDLTEAAYTPGAFDLVTMWAVLEHVYHPSQMLHEIRKILRVGGKLILAVTNFNSLPARFMRHDDIPRHTTLFTKRTLGKMLQKSDFMVDYYRFGYELYGGSHRGILNYLVKLMAGEKLDDIVASNRSARRWDEFSSRLRGKPSTLMTRIDRLDIDFSPKLDRMMDRLHRGFIMIARATKQS